MTEMIVKVHRIGLVVGRVVWPLVMKVFVTGITQNCCKWLSGTDSFNLLRNKNPIWLWHFSNLSWSPWWHRHELIEPLNRNPRTDGMLGSVGSCLFRIFHSWENEILAGITIDCVNMIFPGSGSKMLKSQLVAASYLVVPTFLVDFANNRRRQGEAI